MLEIFLIAVKILFVIGGKQNGKRKLKLSKKFHLAKA